MKYRIIGIVVIGVACTPVGLHSIIILFLFALGDFKTKTKKPKKILFSVKK